MAFDQSSILEVLPPVWDGSTLQVSWISSAPPNTTFQVYVGRRLAWHGKSRWASFPMPSSRVRIDVGAVGPGEAAVDFSDSLPSAPDDRVTLSWLGGSYLDPTGDDDVHRFRIYGSRRPGWGVDFTSPLAEIPVYTGGQPIDGFGLGGFGLGGFGRAASSYSWTSPALEAGVWNFAVATVDAAGNQGSPSVMSAVVTAPPRPPAAGEGGLRLRCDYEPDARTATLSWNPSPV